MTQQRKLWDISIILLCAFIFFSIVNLLTEDIIFTDQLLVQSIVYILASILAFDITVVIAGLLISKHSDEIINGYFNVIPPIVIILFCIGTSIAIIFFLVFT